MLDDPCVEKSVSMTTLTKESGILVQVPHEKLECGIVGVRQCVDTFMQSNVPQPVILDF